MNSNKLTKLNIIFGDIYALTHEYTLNFVETRSLDSGNFSTVFEARSKKNNKLYAIKKIPLREEDSERTLNEIRLLSDLHSDYVVNYIKYWVEDNYYKGKYNKDVNCLLADPEKPFLLHIQLELCEITLAKFILSIEDNKHKNSIKTKYYSITTEILDQILESVNYLHNLNPPIIHRDLKPENILIFRIGNRRCVKLTDFGLSTYHEFVDQSHSSGIGSPGYRAPELNFRNYTLKVDIYSTGRIMTQLFNIDFNRPWKFNSLTISKKYEVIKQISLSCVSQSSDIRPTCQDILERKSEWEHLHDIEKTLIQKIDENRTVPDSWTDTFVFYLNNLLDFLRILNFDWKFIFMIIFTLIILLLNKYM